MNRQIILASRPSGLPTNQNFDLIEVDERAPRNGEVLCKTIYLSLDPYMRGRMNEAKSYAKPVNLGDVMEGEAVSQVIKSKSDKFQVGDFVMGRTGWQDKPTAHARLFKKVDPNKAPISTSIGILGMPGVTAYTGMMNIAKPQRDETLVVAAASGAVGSTVGQIGKIFGCKVIGITGTSEKCAYVTNQLGFDVCLDHQSQNFETDLKSACQNGIDIYWENVGGKVFDAVLPLLNDFSRVPVCGLISRYNTTDLPDGPDRLPLLFRYALTKRLLIRGFIVFDFEDQRAEALNQLQTWIKEGKLNYKEDFIDGIENAPKAFLGLLSGKNFGKLIVRVSDDPTL